MTVKRVFVAGHRGMVGSAIARQIAGRQSHVLITRTRSELDLTDSLAVKKFFDDQRPSDVYLAAAKVGGIIANSAYPADFIRENLQIQCNVINAAFKSGVRRLLFLGSSCIYPKHAKQPMCEEQLLSGSLEPTNEPYAIAKIAGIKMCESYNRQFGTDYRSVMPSNLYGPGDNYHPDNSHVIPGLIRRFHEAKLTGAKQVVVWGSGKVFREFLYVDDLASACVRVMELDRSEWECLGSAMCSHINVGSNEEVEISSLARMVAETVGFVGQIVFDDSKPDGTPRKLMNSSKMFSLDWRPNIGLLEGLAKSYASFLQQGADSAPIRGLR